MRKLSLKSNSNINCTYLVKVRSTGIAPIAAKPTRRILGSAGIWAVWLRRRRSGGQSINAQKALRKYGRR
jgi:hypothetical protein